MVIADIFKQSEDSRIIIKEIAFDTVEWKESDRNVLLKLASNKGDVRDVCLANFMVGETFATAILSTLKKFNVTPEDIQLIGSHGQTIWHEVARGKYKASLIS